MHQGSIRKVQCFEHSVLTTSKKGWNQRGEEKNCEFKQIFSFLSHLDIFIFGYYLGMPGDDDNDDEKTTPFSPKKWPKNSYFGAHNSGSTDFRGGWDPIF